MQVDHNEAVDWEDVETLATRSGDIAAMQRKLTLWRMLFADDEVTTFLVAQTLQTLGNFLTLESWRKCSKQTSSNGWQCAPERPIHPFWSLSFAFGTCLFFALACLCLT